MPVTNICDLISSYVDDHSKRSLYNERKVIDLWREEMGDFINKSTKFIDIKSGVLKVKITNAALRFELLNSRTDIMNKLNGKLGTETIKDLIIN
ncbi:MAG: DUF721 domain-containing protein [Bacteroidales bacterium]|nr:DUF721 domain-containing protein [Bacteroidales bacterium]MBQ7489893.1 DUF721 domain-containing protein [Bacteroidales bacterium]